jgi:hypothetical protein
MIKLIFVALAWYTPLQITSCLYAKDESRIEGNDQTHDFGDVRS